MLSNSLCLSPLASGDQLFWASFCTGRSFTGSNFSFSALSLSDTVCEVGLGSGEDVSAMKRVVGSLGEGGLGSEEAACAWV